MNKLKGKLSLLLAVIIMMATFMPVLTVYAANTDVEMSLIVKYNNAQLKDGQTLNIKPGSVIDVTVDTPYTEGLEIAYYWNGGAINTFPIGQKTGKITLPNFEAGTKNTLQVQAIINDYTHGIFKVIDKFVYTIEIPKTTEISTSLKYNNSTVSTTKAIEVAAGEKLYATATSTNGVKTFVYRWDNEGLMQFPAGTTTGLIVVPNYAAGSTHTLKLQAVSNDSVASEPKSYTIKIPQVQEEVEMSLIVKQAGKTLKDKQVLTLEPGAIFDVTVDTPYTEGLEIAYYWNGGKINTFPIGQKTGKITLPNYAAGSTNTLQVQAIINDNTHNIHEVIDKFTYTIKIPEAQAPATEISTSLKYNNSTVPTNKTVEVPVGGKLYVTAISNNGVKTLVYRWDNETLMQFPAGTTTGLIVVPSYADGTTHTLKVQAVANDGVASTPMVYTIKIPDAVVVPPVEETEITVGLKYYGTTLSTNKDVRVYLDDELDAVTSCNIDVEKIVYYWDEGATQTINAAKGKIAIPSNFVVDSEHTLTLYAIAEDGTRSADKEYTIIIDEEYNNEEDDELIIEPWMEENDDLDTLAISLRNDSEEEKENKNIYELEEEIIYYVDYKNGGKDISKKVTLVLNVPETFKVVSADGGSVSTSKGTITWTFNGLDEDEAGTKTVVLKYTKIGNSKVSYKIVKPLAEIKVDGKVKDESAVINLIYKDKDTEIKDLHLPYMFGDKDKPTFRPDDTITRAEGALVLTRIFGISTSYDNSSYNYPDLDQTYLEARKAIIAATEYGIINGYEDGTYKPNKAMTRAEFLKIIANRVAIENDDGFEIKDIESSIKLYDDPTRVYVVNNEYLTEHWALEEVSLLARLNMTPLTDSNTNLRLDEPITRAEVAQLVNLYLLRAPADVTSKTKSGFSDVSKNHKLFADIIEATREAHTYYITDETTEEAEF